jgi:hypothetical protein
MKFDNVKRWSICLTAVVLITTALGGCAGGGAGAPTVITPGVTSSSPEATSSGDSTIKRDSAGAVDPCALLTLAQIEAVIGTPVVETIPYGDIECRWKVKPLAAFPGSVDPWLDVQFFPNDTQMRDVEAAPGTEGVVAIGGLGDRAFRTNQNRHLWVQHGNDVFVVRSSLTDLSDESEINRSAAEAIEVFLARLVLDQL